MRTSLLLHAASIAAISSCLSLTSYAQQTSSSKTKSANSISVGSPEIIFFNGVIYTGAGFSEDKPEIVQAMAVGGGKVIAVGSDKEIKRLAGLKTLLRDLN